MISNTFRLIATALCAAVFALATAYADTAKTPQIQSQWNGKKVAYLGDSITDKCHVGTSKNYWQFLEDILGIQPKVYGINGHSFGGVLGQAEKLKASGEEIDAIFIFAGTNDYNGSVALGEWYKYSQQQAQINQTETKPRQRREFAMDGTFKGRINKVMAFLKENFPNKQIILLTPIHRGFANFGGSNVQPDESVPNRLGLYVDSYVDAVKEAGNVWAVPVIDLNAICGLMPNLPSHSQFSRTKSATDSTPTQRGTREWGWQSPTSCSATPFFKRD